MAFRADEAKEETFEKALRRLTTGIPREHHQRARDVLNELVEEHGAVVQSYPTWHPLVDTGVGGIERYIPPMPGNDTGYNGIDHPVYFVNAFLTCPYSDGTDVIMSVEALNKMPEKRNHSTIYRAEVLPDLLYHPKTTPVLVHATSHIDLDARGMVTKRAALEGLLRYALRAAPRAEVAEPWENISVDLLGTPCGKRSSLFIDEETGNAMRTIINQLNKSGIFGESMAFQNRRLR